ncbi:hypothetical protein GJR99_09120 [Haloferax sp. MBLA0078]|uniref:Uncharacterized protein n=1 Tax=Haloferax marinum TaxID=2666143 RepID=A0A6A8G6G2_9EURY|nr:hypothetical protein [Haloferax marinum]MRW96734.1 hypothetical protein [Haloferax marinum]
MGNDDAGRLGGGTNPPCPVESPEWEGNWWNRSRGRQTVSNSSAGT